MTEYSVRTDVGSAVQSEASSMFSFDMSPSSPGSPSRRSRKVSEEQLSGGQAVLCGPPEHETSLMTMSRAQRALL